MLAQNFMTATDLGITDAEHVALIKVLGMLERGDITAKQFDMGNWIHSCGTACCIGGWACAIGGDEIFQLTHGPVDNLFFPPLTIQAAWRATPEQGAAALRNLLTRGDADWASACSISSAEHQK